MTKPPGQVTLQDVADAAGVSLSTASRALNGEASGRRVTEPLRQRVLEVARNLNFVPNPHAQATARGRSRMVGVVINDIIDPYFSNVVAGVMDAVAASGREQVVSIANTRRSDEAEARNLAMLRIQRASIVVLIGSRRLGESSALREEITKFIDSGGRFVAVSQPLPGVDTVSPANKEGAGAMARSLIGLGYSTFGILAGPAELRTAIDRVDGFTRTVESMGGSLNEKAVVHSSFDREGGYEAVQTLLSRGRLPRCLFATNDLMAIGGMAALRDNRVAVPEDVAMAGFDGISLSMDVTPGLTTVQLPLRRLGERAMELATQNPSSSARHESILGKVVIRDSTPSIV